jgi:single-strand DNA-binding protein
MNKCTIMGNCGSDPELRYTPTGRAVANVRVAVNRRWRDAEGQLQEKVEWFRVVAWGRLAELLNQYCAKGSPVYIEGRLETRSFEGADGQLRYLTEVVAQDLILLPRGNGNGTPAEETAEVEEEELAESPL